MIEIVFLAIVLIIALFTYLTILKPYLVYKKYVKLLPSFGYKIFVHPFRPLGASVREMTKKDSQTYGDAVKSFKQVYPHFDLSICNIHNQTVLELVNPDLIKEFYKNAQENCYIKADILTSSFKMLIKNGIIMKQGQQWKQRKKIISSVFTHNFLVSLIPEIHKICQNRLNQMEKNTKIKSNQQNFEVFEVDFHLIFQGIFSEVIVRLFFGSEPTQTLDDKNICQFINQLMAGFVKQLKSPLFTLFGQVVASAQLKRKLKSFKLLAQNLINKRLKQIKSEAIKPSQPRDIIQALVLSGQFSYKQRKQEKNSDLFTYDDLIGQFCTFFVAGMDTTSNFMTSLVYHLAKKSSQNILSKVRQEVQTLFSQKQGKLLVFQDLKKLKYTELVQKQDLRMFSPVTGIFFSKATKRHFLKDIPIQKGIAIAVRNRANFFKEEYFDEPFEFRPERWSVPNQKLHPYGFLPFSYGARTCIGNHLSLIQSQIVLAQVLHRYVDMKLQKENYKMVITFLYAPEKVKMTLKKKSVIIE